MTETVQEGVGAGGTFAAMRFRHYRILWWGSLAAYFAIASQLFARAYLAKELTDSNAGLGGAFLGFGLPMALTIPWAGVAVDRLPKRTVMAISVVLLFLATLWLGIAVELDIVAYWMVIGSAALHGMAAAFFLPGRLAFAAELVDRRDLANAVVLAQMANECMRVVGPALAGPLIAWAAFGVGGVLLLCAALCVVSIITVLRMPRIAPGAVRTPRAPLADLVAGARYLRRTPGLSLLAVTGLAIFMVAVPYMAFYPAIADLFDRGSGGQGLVAVSAGIGAVLSGLYLARPHRRNPWIFLVSSGVAVGASLVLMGVAPTFGIELAGMLAIGASVLGFQTTIQSMLLMLSQAEFHGRVQSVIVLGSAATGVAALPLGVLADAIGLRGMFAVMGALAFAVMAVFTLRSRRYRGIDVNLI